MRNGHTTLDEIAVLAQRLQKSIEELPGGAIYHDVSKAHARKTLARC
jgi:hypothetical protein